MKKGVTGQIRRAFFAVMKKPGVPPVVLQISTGRLQDMFRLICESLPGAIATPH